MQNILVHSITKFYYSSPRWCKIASSPQEWDVKRPPPGIGLYAVKWAALLQNMHSNIIVHEALSIGNIRLFELSDMI